MTIYDSKDVIVKDKDYAAPTHSRRSRLGLVQKLYYDQTAKNAVSASG